MSRVTIQVSIAVASVTIGGRVMAVAVREVRIVVRELDDGRGGR